MPTFMATQGSVMQPSAALFEFATGSPASTGIQSR
jgi:hypothetical protein